MNKPFTVVESFLSHLIHIAVFLYPITVVSIPDAGPTLFGLLALLSIIVFIFLYPKLNSIREEKLLFFSSALIFGLAMVTAYSGGFNELAWQKMNTFLNLLMVIPLYFLFKNYLIRTRLVWWGLFFGVVISGLIAIYESQWGSLFEDWKGRASGATHPILFADIALTMSFILLVAGSVIVKWNKKYIFAFLVIVTLGLTAVILSKFKGVWIVIPVLIVFMFWRYKSHLPRKVLLLFAIFVMIAPVMFYVIPGSGIKEGIDTTIQDIEKYSDGRHQQKVSLGTRFEMMHASWLIFIEQPLIGAGWGHYIEATQKYVDQNIIDSSAAAWNHPHNQYFSMMASGGLLMLIALMYFFLIPLDMFRRFVSFPDKEVRAYALGGLVLIISFIGYAVSEAIFERSLSSGFYAFYLALFFALMYRTKQESCEQSINRTEKISVILIAYNEIDRIEDCLASVAGWADEIIVFDNGSTDGTIDLIKKYTDKVFVTDWPG
ncbi:MAG: O-antigen ligase family protein, partial [Gammaproteobacteria bacterium]|nr:O-antigen ligase family protein [Gammaproteobacteria bacterium]